MDSNKVYQNPEWTEHTNPTRGKQSANVSERLEDMHGKPNQPAAWRNFSHQPCHSYDERHTEIPDCGVEGKCVCWGGPDGGGAANSMNSDVEEELELPLPLKADNEFQNQSPFLFPQYADFQHMKDARHCYFAEERQDNNPPGNTYFPQSFSQAAQYFKKWNDLETWSQSCSGDDVELCGVSVNVPQFSLPPPEGPTQVRVQHLSFDGEEMSFLQPQEKRNGFDLPEEDRSVFITYSLDISSEMVTFVEFLRKHGFHPAIDLCSNPVAHMDINEWSDKYLKDHSSPVIIAISPQYRRDIGGSAEDNHGLHTKYIHTLIQNEFILQGSLNFRFIPVLFLGAVQKDVPSWLQNTHIYRWPQDTEDLLLRLLKEEKYIPPFVPVELAHLTQPVNTN